MERERLLDEIRDRLVLRLRLVRLIAFGSYVRGTAGPDSDLDLLVVEEGGGTVGDRNVRVRDALGRLGVPLDLLVYTPEEFERQRHWRSSIAAVAEREGRVLYERR